MVYDAGSQKVRAPSHHSPPSDGPARDMEPVANEDGPVLVSSCGHGPGGCMPLPSPVSVPCKAVRVAHGRAASVAPATQQEQSITSCCCRRIHPKGVMFA